MIARPLVGTTLVGYFYRRACQNAGREVDKEPLRYGGPRPQTREAGILMLADSVEAAARAASDHSPEHLALIIQKIVDDRSRDGQLNESDLTLGDLEQTRDTFAAVLADVL